MGIFIEFLGARETGVNKMKISALMELTVCWGKHVVKVGSTKPADPLDVREDDQVFTEHLLHVRHGMQR